MDCPDKPGNDGMGEHAKSHHHHDVIPAEAVIDPEI
jgi:hypothetical protein